MTLLHKDVTRLQKENIKLKAEIEVFDKDIKNTHQPVNTEDPRKTSEQSLESEQKLKEALQSRNDVQAKLLTLQKNLTNQSSQLQTLSMKLEQTDRALQDSKIEKNNILKDFKNLEEERDSLKNAVELIEKSVDEVCQRVAAVCKERDVARELYNQVHNELERIRREKPSKHNSQIPVDHTEDGLNQKIQSLESDNEALKKSCDEWKEQVQILKEDMKALVLRQRENGSLAGEAVSLLEKELEE